MILVIGVTILSLLPAVFLYFWLKNKMRKPADENYRAACRSALLYGFLSTVFTVLFSLAFRLLGNAIGLRNGTSLLAAAYHDFIVLALSEEICKTWMMTKVLKKTGYSYTWQDMIVFMVLVSIGFELLESVVSALTSNPIQILVRGVLIMHGIFGFIEGWFYGKACYTGKKHYAAIGFVIAWLYHGAYDFGLSEKFAELGEYSAFLSVSLAALSLVLVIVMIIFFAKKNKKPQYLEPLPQAEIK